MKSKPYSVSPLPHAPSKSYSVTHLALLLVLGLGVVLTGYLYAGERADERKWLKEKFEEEARDYYNTLHKTIERNIDDITTLRACYRSSQDVNRQEFISMAQHLISRNPCLQALEWLQRVPAGARSTWEKKMHEEGVSQFQITERDRQGRMMPAADRDEYYVISYVEPYTGNEAALGYDPSSEATRRTALYKSRDTGEVISSDWIKPVQAKDSKFGIVLSAPVYRNDLPAGDVSQRRQAIQGFVVGVVKLRKMIEVAWAEKPNPGLDIHLDDLSAYSDAQNREAHFLDLGHENSWQPMERAPITEMSSMEIVKTLQVADHAWRISFSPLPAFYRTYERNASQRTLWIGISVTLLLAIYLDFLMHRAEQARRHTAELGRSQVELQESRERFAGIIAMASDAIICLDEQRKIILFNKGAEKSFGYRPEEVIGRPVELLLPESPGEAGNGVVRTDTESGSDQGHETRKTIYGLRKDGKTFPAEASVSRLRMGGAGILTLILRDRSEQDLLESQLRHAQKMDAIGQLAGGVAHDFNNILTVIIGNTSYLLSQIPPLHPHHELVDDILNAGTRAAEVTRQLLAFSRKQVVRTRVIDLNQSINELRKVLMRLIREDIQVATALEPDLWKMRADASQIDQVIVNLVVNARDAMPKGGELRIETGNVTLDQSLNELHGSLDAGQYVVLTVRDQGTGMDEATLAHIFEPFFTTKEPGKGTGLGLATVYGIVKQIGGLIAVESKPGRGTTFRLYFPRTREEDAGAGNPGTPVASGSRARGATVLIVEDDDLLRNFLLNALTQSGVKAQAVSGGTEALDLLCARGGQFHLLLTDVVMPGLNGAELAAQVAKDYPSIKILFMSGYPDDSHGKKLLDMEGANFIAKPFTAGELTEKIQRILEG